MSFAKAYQHTMSHEGSYSNNPSDRGGETWKGIARNFWPKWQGWEIVDECKENAGNKLHVALNADEELEDLVTDFYKAQFYDALNCQLFPEAIQIELFDTAVNMGIGIASRFLQEALNMLNLQYNGQQGIKVDGRIGQKTKRAFDVYMKTAEWSSRSRAKNIASLLKVLNGLQFERYKEICAKSTDQTVFLYGWLNRV